MLFSTVLTWLLIAVGFVVALPALWLLARGLWPAQAERAREAARGGVTRAFLTGLIPAALGTLLVLFVARKLHFGFVSALLGGVLIAWGFIGAGGIATLIGERLWPQLSVEPWRQTKHGGLVLICAALLPLVGWVIVLPLIAVIGWGINLQAWLAKKKALPAPPAATASAASGV